MMFAEKLKQAMKEKEMNLTALAVASGVGKSSISQYLSGKNKPGAKALAAISEVLGVTDDYFLDSISDVPESSTDNSQNLSVKQAAKLMGVGEQFIRVGIQCGALPFGCAVKISGNRYTYYISPKKFTEYTGLKVM